MNIAEIRQKFPQYNDLSDDDLASALHEKFYSDMSRDEFNAAIGHRPGNVVTRAAKALTEAVRGKQDERYKGTPAFSAGRANLTPEQLGRLLPDEAAGKATAYTDTGLGNILKKSLGEAFIGMVKDANGYPLITYRDKDGREVTEYVNKPGLDWQDIDRGVSTALPFLLTGGAAGAATRGAGTAGRAVTQGTTAFGTSIGQDMAAAGLGSEEQVDAGRAALTAGAGAAAELVAPVASAGWRWFRGGKQYLDDAGKLRPDAAAKAREAGLEPEQMSAVDIERFVAGLNVSADPAEVAVKVQTDRFGIPTTKGQRTKDPQLLTIEKDARYGNLGQEAKDAMVRLDKEQAAAIEDAAFAGGVGGRFAPSRSTADRHPMVLGDAVQDAAAKARQAAKDIEGRAWAGVREITAKPEALDLMAPTIMQRLDVTIDEALTPVAARMEKDLAAFVSGTMAPKSSATLLRQGEIKDILQMRRRLQSMQQAAQRGTPDARAAAQIFDGFNEWLDVASRQSLLNGDETAFGAMRSAIDISRELKGLFQPRSQGKLTPAAKIINEVVENADTPERVIATLFGAAGPTQAPRAGVVDALTRMRTILTRNDLGGAAGAAAWNDIRLAYWSKLVTDKRGEMLSPTMIGNRLGEAFRNQGSIIRELFPGDDEKLIREFAAAIRAAAYKDPNPSGTATAVRAAMKNEGDSMLKTALQTQSKRELFSKHNVMMSRIYAALAKKMPANIFQSRDAIGLAATRRAISQDLTRKPPFLLGHYGSAGAAAYQQGGGE